MASGTFSHKLLLYHVIRQDKDKISLGTQASHLLSSYSTLPESSLQLHCFLNGPLKRLCAFSLLLPSAQRLHPESLLYWAFKPLRAHTGTMTLPPEPRIMLPCFSPYQFLLQSSAAEFSKNLNLTLLLVPQNL